MPAKYWVLCIIFIDEVARRGRGLCIRVEEGENTRTRGGGGERTGREEEWRCDKTKWFC